MTTAIAALVAVAATSLVAACDTGDGRELSPPVLPPPTSTIPPTINSGSLGEANAPTQPIQPFAMVVPWQVGAEIPAHHTCDGDDIAPAVSWSGVPDGTVELALVVTDDDAGGFVHWILTGFDPAMQSMLEGVVPLDARQWPNSFGASQWNGPCPPTGSTHTYRFVLHALNQAPEVADDVPVDELLAIIDGLTLASTSVTGTYTR